MKKSFWFVFLFFCLTASAQEIGVKTNLLYDVVTVFNLGAEVGLSPKWTIDVSANYSPITWADNRKWKHWMLQPEARYWFCERFNGHFIGIHLLGGQHNVGNIKMPFGLYPLLKENRYEGYFYGAGLVYGYQWVLNNRWNVEASIGAGYIRGVSDRYDCPKCGEWKGKENFNYFGPTKAAISLIYIIK